MNSSSMEGPTHVASARPVNGIFQGGGAKSIAYAGALRAVRDRDIWFGSVAGASAGAITASLIASGMDVDELEVAIPEILAATTSPIAVRLGLAALGKATSVFEGGGLRARLNEMLADRIGASSTTPVTFRQLHAATGIELYVLALDLATELPVVFCRRTTPDVEVAGAVVSSSAIPSVFPAGRAVFGRPEGGARVHQLMDGAGWANYPAFIFQDRGFRTWLRGESELEGRWSDDDERVWADEAVRPVVGFVLGAAEPSEYRSSVGMVPLDGPAIDRRFDLGPTYTSRKPLTYLIGATLSSDWARLMVALALLVWTSLSVSTLPTAFRRFSTWLAEWTPDALYPILLVASLTVAVLAIVIAITTIALLMLASRLLADTLLPAITTTLGVPQDVPPWIGLGDDSVVIRVPDDTLKTIDFDLDEAHRNTAIAIAEAGVNAQFGHATVGARLDALFEGAAPPPVPYERAAPPSFGSDVLRPSSAPTVIILAVATAAIGGLAWWATTWAGSAGIWEIIGVLVTTIVGIGVALRYIGGRTGRRAHLRASTDATADSLPPRIAPALMTSVGVALLVGGAALSYVAMDARADDTSGAEVVAATGGERDNDYLIDVDGIDVDVALVSKRHLRLGERVFVELDEETSTYSLAGPVDDVRFGAAVALCAVGIGALTSAARSRRWTRRCRRLDDVVGGWKQG